MGPPLRLTRVEGWEGRLAALLAARMRQPFAWGENDCASLGIDAVEALTHERIWTVDWDDAASAARAITAAGGLVEAWSSRLGEPTDNPLMARRGDIGLLALDGRDTIAVCTGRTFCAPGVEHLEHMPLEEARLVWRVG